MNIIFNEQSQMMTRKQASEYLGIKEQTLACWSSNNRYGLPYYKIGRKVKYKLEDLQNFIQRNQFGLGGDYAK